MQHIWSPSVLNLFCSMWHSHFELHMFTFGLTHGQQFKNKHEITHITWLSFCHWTHWNKCRKENTVVILRSLFSWTVILFFQSWLSFFFKFTTLSITHNKNDKKKSTQIKGLGADDILNKQINIVLYIKKTSEH